jgi:hypothetical protein
MQTVIVSLHNGQPFAEVARDQISKGMLECDERYDLDTLPEIDPNDYTLAVEVPGQLCRLEDATHLIQLGVDESFVTVESWVKSGSVHETIVANERWFEQIAVEDRQGVADKLLEYIAESGVATYWAVEYDSAVIFGIKQ